MLNEKKIKVVGMSDLHGYLPKQIPECDVVVIAGDIVPLDIQWDFIRSISWFLLDFKPWAEKLPCDKVIFTGGNHDDFLYQMGPVEGRTPSESMKKLLGNHKGESKLVYLCDNSYEYKGKRFYGFPWCPELSNWPFYKDHDDLEKACALLPKQCDVLITHCPPSYGLGGTVLQKGNNWMRNFGCVELSEAITFRDIKWIICGHIHSGNHQPEMVNFTNIVNVSLKDEDYKVSYEPFIFEV